MLVNNNIIEVSWEMPFSNVIVLVFEKLLQINTKCKFQIGKSNAKLASLSISQIKGCNCLILLLHQNDSTCQTDSAGH